MLTQVSKHPAQTSAAKKARVPGRGAAGHHLLTVNVEDYFQAGVFRKFISAKNWYRFESRLQQNVERVLELLDNHNTHATFFVLGWTAEQEPALIRRIVAAGHEVASRGYLHQSLVKLSKSEIREDLGRSKSVLEDVTGQAIDGFRLSDGWLNRKTLWLLDEIAAAGYRYDSSLLPKQKDFPGQPQWRHVQTRDTAHGSLIEIPLTTLTTPGGWLPIAGGNYQRQFPDFVMQRLVRRAVKSGADPFVMYFQVWELDSEQPRLSVADRFTKVRHYRKLDKYSRILPLYLQRYRFTSIKEHASLENSPLGELTAPIDDVKRTSDQQNMQFSTSVAPFVHLPDQISEEPWPRHGEAASPSRPGTPSVKPPVTIVIPCFNEEGSLSYLSNTLSSVTRQLSQHWTPNILFVDDCSSDSTCTVLQREFADAPNVRVVRHPVNRGVSAAILTGIEAADTEIVCSMDCDCSYDPHELADMLPLLTEDVSMVTASPYHRDGLVRNVPGWRLLLSRSLSVLYQRLLSQPLATWTSCFRVYRRSHILDLPLTEDGFLGTAELAAQLVLRERVITEHPATLEVRLFGQSKMQTVRAILSHLRLLTRIAASCLGNRNHHPEQQAGPPLVNNEVLQ